MLAHLRAADPTSCRCCMCVFDLELFGCVRMASSSPCPSVVLGKVLFTSCPVEQCKRAYLLCRGSTSADSALTERFGRCCSMHAAQSDEVLTLRFISVQMIHSLGQGADAF